MPPRRSFARRGAGVGALVGLFFVWRIMAGAIDPTVTEHKGIFPAAVMFVCVFACFVFGVSVLVGACVGKCIKLSGKTASDASNPP